MTLVTTSNMMSFSKVMRDSKKLWTLQIQVKTLHISDSPQDLHKAAQKQASILGRADDSGDDIACRIVQKTKYYSSELCGTYAKMLAIAEHYAHTVILCETPHGQVCFFFIGKNRQIQALSRAPDAAA